MDNFDYESLDSYIKKYKNNIVYKLETIQWNDKTISNQCNDVCMVLEYSPKISKRQQYSAKYLIQTEKRNYDMFHHPVSNLSLSLENKPVDEGDEEEECYEEGDEENEEGIDEMSMNDLGQNKKVNNKKVNNEQESCSSSKNKQMKKKGGGESESTNDNIPRSSVREINTNEHNSQEGNGRLLAYNMNEERYTYGNLKRNRLLMEGKIRVYVLNTEKFLEFEIGNEETFKQLKRKVLDKLLKAANFVIEHNSIESYELRLVNAYNIVLFNEPTIDESKLIMSKGEDVIAFLAKQQVVGFARISTIPKQPKLIGNVISSSEVDMINMRIYIKLNEDNSSSTILQIPTESTLKNVIEILADKSRIPYKNENLYYITEHSHNNAKIDDFDDGLSIDLQLKYLSTFEIDNSSMTEKVYISNSKKHKVKEDVGRDYVFNPKTAVQYKEFEVFKIKKSKAKQDRMLGIDQYYLYNDLPKNRINQTNIITLLHAKVKHPLRKIKDIKDCGMLSNKSLYIELITDKESISTKKIVYEVKSTNNRNEIVNKLKYLIVRIIYI